VRVFGDKRSDVARSSRATREMAIYPFQMCEAFLKGLRQHLDRQGGVRIQINAVLPAGAQEEEDLELDANSMIIAQPKNHPSCVYDPTTGPF